MQTHCGPRGWESHINSLLLRDSDAFGVWSGSTQTWSFFSPRKKGNLLPGPVQGGQSKASQTQTCPGGITGKRGGEWWWECHIAKRKVSLREETHFCALPILHSSGWILSVILLWGPRSSFLLTKTSPKGLPLYVDLSSAQLYSTNPNWGKVVEEPLYVSAGALCSQRQDLLKQSSGLGWDPAYRQMYNHPFILYARI